MDLAKEKKPDVKFIGKDSWEKGHENFERVVADRRIRQ